MIPNAPLPLADALGTHAIAFFAAALCMLLLVVTAGWWLLRVWAAHPLHGRMPPPARVLIRGMAGAAIVIGAAMAFAHIAEAVGSDGELARFDETLTASIARSTGTATLYAFSLVTRLANTEWLALLGTVVAVWLWYKHRRAMAAGWVLAVGGNALINPALKRVFERVRPVHDHGIVSELGWSFPSGHTSGATVAYGMLACIAIHVLPARWHLPTLLAAAAVAFTVGCSRIFLQVHFVSDVAAGFASGAAWLTVCIASVELSRRWSAHL